ncbi:MAG TPA: HAMP domain-containing sensor histidine kinase [Gaiellaceae bacterium]|nr:HAMP domain-containing sensor histidine kinase [Gaiellaceae bacterium]
MSRLGLRSRLALALVAVAVLAIGVATILGDIGLKPRLSSTAHARLERSAQHFSEVTSVVYAEAGSWQRAQPTLRHLAALDDLHAEVRMGGRLVARTDPLGEIRASAPLTVGPRRVGTVTISPASGRLYTPEERSLRVSLDRLHLITGGIAVVAALLIAFLLAETLTRPLRRLRETAERMERGEVDARVPAQGSAEFVALGRALNRLAETLEHEEEVRKANAADLAHELRTPVNTLLSRIEAAQDGVLEDRENLEAMHNEAVRLTRLLDDLARLADAERPGMLLEKRSVDLADVARTVAASFAPRFEGSGVELDVDLQPAVVAGDRSRLEQIATNLIANAHRYTDSGEVRITVRRDESTAVLEVADTGVGIPAGDLRYIFTRFWRGDRSRSRATGGAGIGLAIVRELVRAHDGRVDVDSTPGKGSTFRVVLPVADGGPARRSRNEGRPTSGPHG